MQDAFNNTITWGATVCHNPGTELAEPQRPALPAPTAKQDDPDMLAASDADPMEADEDWHSAVEDMDTVLDEEGSITGDTHAPEGSEYPTAIGTELHLRRLCSMPSAC
jgi:hypothetical protein